MGGVTMPWACKICGIEHDDLPPCFGIEAPWRALVPEEDFSERVELTNDQCIVDRQSFFIRGHIEIPIHGHHETLAFSVWSSLSETSFAHMTSRWNDQDRANDPPYFGWLCSPISVYPNALHLKLSVKSRAPGWCPLYTVEDSQHALAADQRTGISIDRWHQLVHEILG
jgi:hypothetical protein